MNDDREFVTICSICARRGIDCFMNPECLRPITSCPDFLVVVS